MTCFVPEDPAAVAAREKRNQRYALLLGGAIVGFGLYGFVRWVKDTASLVNESYERKSWDV